MTDTPADDADFDLFSKAMQGVTPLIQKHERIPLQNCATQDAYTLAQRRLAASHHPTQDANCLSIEHIPKHNPHDCLEYRKPGVQTGVYRKLRLGKYAIEARLDLHQKAVSQARQEVFLFVHDCIRYDLRTVLIVHGKGDRGNDKAIIKSHVAHWLKHMPEVLAYHSARPHHGGVGALYLMLKKSDDSKRKTREQLNNRDF